MVYPLRQELIDLANALVAISPEVLRVAHNEDDKTTSVVKDVAHFLKLNEQRLGRDLELYSFMGDKLEGWEGTLVRFLEEVVLPLKSVAPVAYKVACEKLKEMGKKVYPADLQAQWEEILAA